MKGGKPGRGILTPRQRPVVPARTQAEAFYYLKQIEGGHPMVVTLMGGRQERGRLHWFDDHALGLALGNGVEILIPLDQVKYVAKAEGRRRATEGTESE